MPKVIIDNQEIEVPAGSTVMQAVEKLGMKVPYYCWHPGLSIAGNCRMCLVEIDKSPKPVIACNTQVAEGMIVRTQSEMAKSARKGTLEFLLVNHPLDCPVCDQAGECELQNFYMNYGLYDARFDEEKLKKKKAISIGPTVMLDSERCILCSRCVRFCDEITHTGELGIVNRGDHEEITVYPGKELDNKYSGNVVDICPVGALTDKDFRFKCRVWYLTSTDSVCPGCSMGCNIKIDANLSRPHHAKGERLMRLKPRENPDVNQWWMCDDGRYGYKFVDQNRILKAEHPSKGGKEVIEYDQAISTFGNFLQTAVQANRQSKIGVLVSTHLTNEDMFAIRKFFKMGLKIKNIDYRFAYPKGYADDFLMKADKSPNTAGAMALEMILPTNASGEDILKNIEREGWEGLIIFGVDLAALLGAEKLRLLLGKLKFCYYIGSNVNETSKMVPFVIPSAVYAEKDGTFTNFKGLVQRIWQAFPPLGDARTEWQILCDVAAKMDYVFRYESAEEVFKDMEKNDRSFEGMSYEKLGKRGALCEKGVGIIALTGDIQKAVDKTS